MAPWRWTGSAFSSALRSIRPSRTSTRRLSLSHGGGPLGGHSLFGSDDGTGPLTLHDALVRRGIAPSSFSRDSTAASASIANKSIFQAGADLWHRELVAVSNRVQPQSNFGSKSIKPSYYTGDMLASRLQSSNASVQKEARCAVSGAPEWWSRKDADTRDAIDRAHGLQVSRSVGPSSRYTEQEMGDNFYLPRKTTSNADYSRRYETSRNNFLDGHSTINTRPSTNLGSSIRNYGLGERPTAPVETDDWSAQYKICLERHADSVRRRQAASLRFPITSLPPLPVVEQEIILPGQWGEYGSEEEEEAGTESGGPSIFSSIWSGVTAGLTPGPRPAEEGSGTEGGTAGRSTRMPGQYHSDDDYEEVTDPPHHHPPGTSTRHPRSYHARSRRPGTSYRPTKGRPSTPGAGRRKPESSVSVTSSWESEVDDGTIPEGSVVPPEESEVDERTIQNSPTGSQDSNWDLYN